MERMLEKQARFMRATDLVNLGDLQIIKSRYLTLKRNREIKITSQRIEFRINRTQRM